MMPATFYKRFIIVFTWFIFIDSVILFVGFF